MTTSSSTFQMLSYICAVNPNPEKFDKRCSEFSSLDITGSWIRGDHALCLAAKQGNFSLINHIVSHYGAKILIQTANEQGWTPLHYAACNKDNQEDAIKTVKLLVDLGASVDTTTTEKTDWNEEGLIFEQGLTPIQIAKKIGNLELVNFLNKIK